VFTNSALRTEGKKSVGVFTFALHFGSLEHSFSFTYSEFEEIHTRLTTAFPGTTLPKFPSKHRLRNNTKPENMEKRAQEFCMYLQQLVALPGVLSSERFQFEYHIDGAFARALANGQMSSSNGAAANGVQTNGRPPRSPVAPLPRKEQVASPASSRQESPPARTAKPKPKGLFGLDESDSDPESDSDTSVEQRHQCRLGEDSAWQEEQVALTLELWGQLPSESASCRATEGGSDWLASRTSEPVRWWSWRSAGGNPAGRSA
jgi:hypothetical protein